MFLLANHLNEKTLDAVRFAVYFIRPPKPRQLSEVKAPVLHYQQRCRSQ